LLRAELRAGFGVAGGVPSDNRQDYRHEDAESDQYTERRNEIHPHPDVDGDEDVGHVATAECPAMAGDPVILLDGQRPADPAA
jgi:hypothetical protein